jgi:hypothetical protein
MPNKLVVQPHQLSEKKPLLREERNAEVQSLGREARSFFMGVVESRMISVVVARWRQDFRIFKIAGWRKRQS